MRENYTKTTIVNDLSCKFSNANDLLRSAFYFGAKFCTNARERERISLLQDSAPILFLKKLPYLEMF